MTEFTPWFVACKTLSMDYRRRRLGYDIGFGGLDHVDSKEPDWTKFQDFLKGEVRFASLAKQYPAEAQELFEITQTNAKWRLFFNPQPAISPTKTNTQKLRKAINSIQANA